MNAQKFSHYFGGSPILYVHGRQYPVNVSHASISQSDWLTSTLSTVFQLHEQAPPQHDFLVFLTGQEEIENLAHTIRALSKDLQGSVKIFVLPLYSAQASIMQQKVFIDSPPGSRKIILSTNIAETSLTIPGIRYVIDSCRVKAKVHMASTGLDMLKVVDKVKGIVTDSSQSENSISWMKKQYLRFLRCNISNVLLQLVASGVRDIRKFEFLQRPPPNAIEGAIRQLSLLGAFKSDESQELTDIGIRLSKFPLDPKFAKAIISANELGCSEEVLTIVALLSSENIILTPPSNREECLKSREKFSSSEGDHISLLNIFRAFKASDNKKDFCKNHHLNLRNLNFSIQIRSQLMDLCRNEDINVQSCANQGHLVREALADGLFMNVAKLTVEGHYLTLDSRQQVKNPPFFSFVSLQARTSYFYGVNSHSKNVIHRLLLFVYRGLLQWRRLEYVECSKAKQLFQSPSFWISAHSRCYFGYDDDGPRSSCSKKNGSRLCGTGSVRSSTPISQSKAYWEVQVQQSGQWSCGLCTPSCDLNKSLGNDQHSWVIDWESNIKSRNEVEYTLEQPVQEGDIIGFTYDHVELNFYLNVLYVDDGAILDYYYNPYKAC
ncbi:DHX33 [Lepeophtheirus salmonis]|uniref:ATP-dependent RNA helicase DDX1 n=1 Tax=Lepeophtheirus salmonis TaxID=72036 RepID=A0A7R8CSS5_LEPSM|nr:DHX33 [Lepeophtheirus salmonis]CAF2917678.1 DHX33 [Lepeophtheirus salmonis]